jgi:glycerol kinase
VSGSVLVVDVGTSGVRAAIVQPDATVAHEEHVPVLPDTPAPGLVEFDAVRMADAVLEVAAGALAAGGPVDAVGIANQRASSCGSAPAGSRSPQASAGRTCARSAPA